MSNSETRIELIKQAGALRPVRLEKRFSELERMGLPAGKSYGDVVSGSRLPQIPVDKDGDLKDRLDKLIRGARKAYAEKLEEARKALDQARAIEQGWLYEAGRAPTKAEKSLASDFGVDCECCCRPIAATPADPVRHGFCGACDKAWTRAERPDRVKFIKDRRAWLEMEEVPA